MSRKVIFLAIAREIVFFLDKNQLIRIISIRLRHLRGNKGDNPPLTEIDKSLNFMYPTA